MNQRMLAVALVVLAVGCGEPAYVPKTTEVLGEVGGIGFTRPYALFSSQDQALGTNTATVFISDHPDACAQISDPARGGGPSYVVDADGNRMPSLILNVPAQSALPGNRHEVGDGFSARFDPGAPSGCRGAMGWTLPSQADGGACPSGMEATSGAIWVYETDSVKVDREPRAKARFDIQTDGGRLQGGFVATPCSAVSACAVDPSTLAVGIGCLVAAMLSRRRGKRRA